jgi:hypothetical protein
MLSVSKKSDKKIIHINPILEDYLKIGNLEVVAKKHEIGVAKMNRLIGSDLLSFCKKTFHDFELKIKELNQRLVNIKQDLATKSYLYELYKKQSLDLKKENDRLRKELKEKAFQPFEVKEYQDLKEKFNQIKQIKKFL